MSDAFVTQNNIHCGLDSIAYYYFQWPFRAPTFETSKKCQRTVPKNLLSLIAHAYIIWTSIARYLLQTKIGKLNFGHITSRTDVKKFPFFLTNFHSTDVNICLKKSIQILLVLCQFFLVKKKLFKSGIRIDTKNHTLFALSQRLCSTPLLKLQNQWGKKVKKNVNSTFRAFS